MEKSIKISELDDDIVMEYLNEYNGLYFTFYQGLSVPALISEYRLYLKSNDFTENRKDALLQTIANKILNIFDAVESI